MFGYYLLTKIIKPGSQLILSGLMIYYTIIYIPLSVFYQLSCSDTFILTYVVEFAQFIYRHSCGL